MFETTKLDLGTSWNEAVESAYDYGYDCFDNEEVRSVTDKRISEHVPEDEKHHFLLNDADTQAMIRNNCSRELWDAIDNFYEQHRSQEEYEQLQREAAVAEDLDIAYETGALDAMLGEEKDFECLEVIKKQEI